MEEVPKFVESFKRFPPRSTPQSFNPANLMEDTLQGIKGKEKAERAFPMLRPKADKSAEE